VSETKGWWHRNKGLFCADSRRVDVDQRVDVRKRPRIRSKLFCEHRPLILTGANKAGVSLSKPAHSHSILVVGGGRAD